MSIKQKIISGLSWQALNVFTQVILQLIFIAVLARLISKEAFGVMAIALVVVGFIEIFSQIGIGPALIQKKDPTEEHISAAFAISVSLGALFTILMYIIAPWVAELYDHEPLTKVLRVIGLSFLISSIAIVPKSLIIKEMAFKKLFIAALVAMSIGNILIGIGMAFMGFDLWAYVAALLSQNLIMMVFYWLFKPIKINHKWDWKIAKELVVYGGGSTLFNFFNYAATKIDTLIVGMLSSQSNITDLGLDQSSENIQNNDDRWATTGIYDRSVYLMGLPITVLGKLSDSVMFSGLSMLQDDLKKLQRAVLSAVYHISLLVIPGTVFLLFFTREITVLFLGDKYEAAVPIVNILFISVTFRSLIKIGDAVVRAVKASYLYKASLIKAFFFLCVAAGTYFGFDYGLKGVAWGLVLAVFIQFLMMGFLNLTILKMNAARAIKKIIPGIICGALVALASYLSLMLLHDVESLLVRALVGGILALLLLIIMATIVPWMFKQGDDNLLKTISDKLPIEFFKNRWK